MKKRIGFVLAAIMLVALMTICVSAAESGTWENFTYTLDDEGTLTISGNGEMPSTSFMSKAPWLSYGEMLKKVVIKDGITSICYRAFFECSNLTSVTIPDSVTTIESSAFSGCTSLTSIVIPDNVTIINSSTFSRCTSLTSIVIPDSVTHIYGYAFFSSGLTSVIIPSSTTFIGEYTFCRCSELTSVAIPSSVTGIGIDAFFACDKLTDIYYSGTEEQWKRIHGSVYSDSLKIHYNTKGNLQIPGNTDSIVEGKESDKLTTSFGSEVSDWAKEEVEEAYDKKLVPEVLVGKDLTQKVNRAEFAAIAVALYENLTGKKATKSTNPFKDISGNACYDDILKAYNLDITTGTSSTTFEPNTNITREQMATMLTRAYKKSEFKDWSIETDGDYPLNFMGVQKFADDNEISDYARESVYFMARWDIIKGIGDNKFAPKNSVTLGEAYGYATREQAVVIALRSAKHL